MFGPHFSSLDPVAGLNIQCFPFDICDAYVLLRNARFRIIVLLTSAREFPAGHARSTKASRDEPIIKGTRELAERTDEKAKKSESGIMPSQDISFSGGELATSVEYEYHGRQNT